jgi:hypothetical protein
MMGTAPATSSKGLKTMIETLSLPIDDGAVGEQRSVATLAGVDHGRSAADVEEHVVLACETRVRQILRCGAGADRNIHSLAARLAEPCAGRDDRGLYLFRPLAAQYRSADVLSHLAEPLAVMRKRLELFGDDRF